MGQRRFGYSASGPGQAYRKLSNPPGEDLGVREHALDVHELPARTLSRQLCGTTSVWTTSLRATYPLSSAIAAN